MSAKYDLSWQKFSQHLYLMLKEIYKVEKYSDVTLVSDDQVHFKAHKIVLSACSPVFKKIIDNSPSQHTLIYLRGIQRYELESVLQFMYLGEGQVFQNRIREFIKVAKDLEVKDICEGDVKLKTQEEESTHNANGNNDEKIIDSEDHYQGEENESLNEPRINTDDMEEHEFDYPATTKNHVSPHEGVQCPCNQCDYQAETLDNLQIHIKSEHERIKYKQDKEKDVSVKMEINDDDNVQDREDSKGENKLSSQCSECGVIFNSKGAMLRHYKNKHQGLKFSCDECDKKFADRGYLNKHIQSKHKGIIYPCDLCEYLAPIKASLKRHVLTVHEGIMYPCHQCDYEGSHKSHLRRHIQNVHEGNKFPCSECDYQAQIILDTLQKHIQSKHEMTKDLGKKIENC